MSNSEPGMGTGRRRPLLSKSPRLLALQAHAGHVVLAQHGHRRLQEVELHALFLGAVGSPP